MKAIFFSDAHILHNEAERAGRLARFIRDVSVDADIVVILGDLFEFYHGHDGHIYPFYREIVDALKETAQNRQVYFVEGNHEFEMGSFFQSYTGATCHRALDIVLDGKKVFLSHGDSFSAKRLDRALRSRFTYTVMDAFGPSLTWWIAMLCRIFLSKTTKPYNERIRDKHREYGRGKLDEGYDAVVLAHSHMPDYVEYESGDRKKVYMNTGDLVKLFTYGVYTTEEGFRVETYHSAI
jgi:UDP-2,3-diacylglucosamine hydrolase